ncbi:MAG: LysR substrate-binding domain-containing protein [Selenomonadaceae bacterium]|nr:LysR substrate-binding domain-containing protein [Selenomonadaceae bacterium]
MELAQLQYFQTMARVGHFTKAADECAVSHSALSRAIGKLEHELGVKLFTRHARHAELTAEGVHFLHHVDRALSELNTAKAEIMEEGKQKDEVFHLSFFHSFGSYLLPMLLAEFHAEYPQIRIKLHQHSSRLIMQQIEAGDTDLALCSTMATEEHIAWVYLWSEELFAAVPKDHPLASRKSITLRDLEPEPLITMKPHYSLRELVNQCFALADCHPKIIFEGSDVNTLASLVAAKLGVSIIPNIPGIEHLGIVYLPISFPICKRPVGIAWNTAKQLSPAALKFQQFVIHHFEKEETP